jgi:inorganic phosphate transporter, PiT family
MRQPRHCRLAACRIHFGAIRFYSLGHGGNDAQKTMGIIPVPAVLAGLNHLSDRDDAGNAGWRLAHREDNGVQDYAYADARLLRGTGGAATLFVSTWLGILVSTTRTSLG